MTLTKRERVFRTLALDGEPDMVPIHHLGFERTGESFQQFAKSEEKKELDTYVKTKSSRVRYYVTEARFWNLDLQAINIFSPSIKYRTQPAPEGFPEDHYMNPISGKVYKNVQQVDTGLIYSWYVGGCFTSPEIVQHYWSRFGKPSELINDSLYYSPKKWEEFVEAVCPYFFPVPDLPLAPHEALFEGMTIGKVAYYMRKNPSFIHSMMEEYTKTNVEIANRLAEANVEVVWMYDDLGYKGQSIFSLRHLREFIIPYYKRIYETCKKHGMLIIQHSCGYIDEVLPYLVDAGLNGIQALEPAAGVDLAHLKNTLGDRICFIGGIDSSRVLNFGTPQDIEEEVKRCINAAGKGGGYFVGASHNILNTPWENVLTLRDAIEKYRKYPIKF